MDRLGTSTWIAWSDPTLGEIVLQVGSFRKMKKIGNALYGEAAATFHRGLPRTATLVADPFGVKGCHVHVEP